MAITAQPLTAVLVTRFALLDVEVESVRPTSTSYRIDSDVYDGVGYVAGLRRVEIDFSISSGLLADVGRPLDLLSMRDLRLRTIVGGRLMSVPIAIDATTYRAETHTVRVQSHTLGEPETVGVAMTAERIADGSITAAGIAATIRRPRAAAAHVREIAPESRPSRRRSIDLSGKLID